MTPIKMYYKEKEIVLVYSFHLEKYEKLFAIIYRPTTKQWDCVSLNDLIPYDQMKKQLKE